MNLKLIAVLFGILLLAGGAFAATTSLQAKNSIAQNYLLSNEVVELVPLDVKYGLQTEAYWVGTVLSEGQIVVFVPVNESSGIVPTISTTQKSDFEKLFQLNVLLRGIYNLQSANQVTITSSEVDKLNNFKQQLEQQKNRLQLINADTELTSSIKAKLTSLIVLVDELDQDTDLTISAFNKLIEKRSSVLKPNIIVKSSDKETLKTDYASIEKNVNDLIDKKDEFVAKRDEVKLDIFNADLDDSKKSNYTDWLFTASVADLDRFKTNSLSEINSVQSLFNYAIPSTLFDELQNRIQLKLANNEIYSEDKNFLAKGGYGSLKEAFETISLFNQTALYRNQSELTLLKKNYADAVAALNKGNYSQSISLAKKAKLNAINVLKAGFNVSTTAPEFPLAIWLIVFVVLIVGIVIVVKFKKQLMGIVKPKAVHHAEGEFHFKKYDEP